MRIWLAPIPDTLTTRKGRAAIVIGFRIALKNLQQDYLRKLLWDTGAPKA